MENTLHSHAAKYLYKCSVMSTDVMKCYTLLCAHSFKLFRFTNFCLQSVTYSRVMYSFYKHCKPSFSCPRVRATSNTLIVGIKMFILKLDGAISLYYFYSFMFNTLICILLICIHSNKVFKVFSFVTAYQILISCQRNSGS